MNNFRYLPALCSLILVSLFVLPVIAATVTCPAACSCLLPAEAAKAGLSAYCSEKKTVCGYDAQKNEKYCYTKTAALVAVTTSPKATSPTPTPFPAPQLAAVAVRPTLTPAVTRFGPEKCPDGCSCKYEPLGASENLSYCGGTQTLCGMDINGVRMYCYRTPRDLSIGKESVTPNNYVLQATPTAPPASPAPSRGPTADCTGTCTCLSRDKADAAGLNACSASGLPCDYDPQGIPMYCFDVVPSGGVSDGAPPSPSIADSAASQTGNRPSDGAPPSPASGEAASPASGNILSSIGSFFASLFGRTATATGPVNGPAVSCIAGRTLCSGNCTDTFSDPSNCGGCGNACLNLVETCCNGVCTNINNNGASCGACNHVCPISQPCLGGGCQERGCSPGTTNCNGSCVSTRTDVNNCGFCGHACADAQYCREAVCTDCTPGNVSCGEYVFERCISLQTSPGNCGSCGHACQANELCTGGTCVSCPASQTRCGVIGGSAFTGTYICTDTQTDEQNCGGCWVRCDNQESCIDGSCRADLLVNQPVPK